MAHVRLAKDRTLRNHFVLLKLFSYGATEAVVVEGKTMLVVK